MDYPAEHYTNYEGWYPAELEAAFEGIKDKQDWRAPIDTWIKPVAYPAARSACMFYTGTELVADGYSLDKDLLHVRAAGYRCGPCGP